MFNYKIHYYEKEFITNSVRFEFFFLWHIVYIIKTEFDFHGLPETKIYDNSQKLGEISEDGTATIRVKKSLTSKTLLAKKTDTNTPQLHFNPRLIQYVYLICLTQLPG